VNGVCGWNGTYGMDWDGFWVLGVCISDGCFDTGNKDKASRVYGGDGLDTDFYLCTFIVFASTRAQK